MVMDPYTYVPIFRPEKFVPVERYLADKVCVRSHEASLRRESPAPGELRHAGAELGHVEPECLLEEEQA